MFHFWKPQHNWQLAWKVVRHFPLSVLLKSFSLLGREHCAYLPDGKLLIQLFECLFERFSVKHRCNIPTCARETLFSHWVVAGMSPSSPLLLITYGMPEFLFCALLLVTYRGPEVCLFAPVLPGRKPGRRMFARLP